MLYLILSHLISFPFVYLLNYFYLYDYLSNANAKTSLFPIALNQRAAFLFYFYSLHKDNSKLKIIKIPIKKHSLHIVMKVVVFVVVVVVVVVFFRFLRSLNERALFFYFHFRVVYLSMFFDVGCYVIALQSKKLKPKRGKESD